MKLRLLVVLFGLLATALRVSATHVVGGEVTYSCLNNNTYNVAVTIYEDCLNGTPEAIAADNPAYLRAYDGAGNVYTPAGVRVSNPDNEGHPYYDSVTFNDDDNLLVPANYNIACLINPPPLCLRKKTFRKQYYLPANATGYTIVYQRCCRNASIINLLHPSEIGATYFCTIPPANLAACNTSAVYKNYPPQIICINNPIYYDNSATDADGDSLSYQFCDTYIGGDAQGAAKPIPDPPPYISVTYVPPYSYKSPMSGDSSIKIDPVSGIISGTPKLLGRYVVTVCCLEWRFGVNINTVKREFQFVVANCSRTAVANTPVFSVEPNTYIVDCKDSTVKFLNSSVGGNTYYWDFGFRRENSAGNDTSAEFEPTITYPDTGTYNVKLVVNRYGSCPDSITRRVKIYPKFHVHYSISGLQCPNSEISFTDHTFSSYLPVTSWEYNFGDGTTSDSENAVHTYTQGGIYYARLASTNTMGCIDTLGRDIVIEQFYPTPADDTTIVKGEHTMLFVSGGVKYAWTPAYNLDDSSRRNPIGYFPDTGDFVYRVHVTSSFGCQGDTSMIVHVIGHPDFFIPTAFTPNGDGKNDVFKPTTIGYESVNYFRIYNRWGQLVHDSHSLNKGWDGTFNGHQADVGTYFWMLSTVNRFGQNENYQGDVTLIR